MVMDDFLLVTLTIPLIDRSLQMDFHKIHNLPALHRVLGLQFSYVMEGQYLAISKYGLMHLSKQKMILESAWLLKDIHE